MATEPHEQEQRANVVDAGGLDPACVTIGPLRLRRCERRPRVDGTTVEGIETTGTAELYEVTGDGLRLTIRDCRWDNGERDVVTIERHDSPQRFDTLVERLRLPVARHGAMLYAELRQVRLRPNARGNLFVPDHAALDAGAGISVAELLLRHDAARVDTREQLLGDSGRTRGRLGVLTAEEADLVPVLAYACTRIAPVCRGLEA